MDKRGRGDRLSHLWDSASRLERLPHFVAVATLKSFRGAALALNVPKSTVSRRVGALEHELNVRLLNRTTRSVTLTAAGEALIEKAAPALEIISDAERALTTVGREPQGPLRVSVPLNVAERVLGPLVPDFLKAYPKVSLTLDASDRFVDLVAEGFDVALRAGHLADSSLKVRQLGMSTAGVFASPSYLAARGTPSHPRDLAAHDAIVFSGSPRGRLWRFGQHKTFTVEVRGRFTANNLELVCGSCVAGLGLAWLPLPIAHEHLRTNRLVEVLSDFAAPPAPLSLLYPSNRQLSPAVRAFIDFIAKHVTLQVPPPKPRRRR